MTTHRYLYVGGHTVSRPPFAGCPLQAPWSNHLFGHNAKSGGWFSNVRLPFQQSVKVTYQAAPGQPDDVIYMIVRGAENLPITIGGITLPTTAKMNLQIVNATFPPLGYVNVVDVPSGNGAWLMHTLSFTAANLNTLEGCYVSSYSH
jgi:hypothetical protein